VISVEGKGLAVVTEHTVWFTASGRRAAAEEDGEVLPAPAEAEPSGPATVPDHVWRHSSALAAARVLNARAAVQQRLA
jgi:hypothetical protein